MPTKNKTTPKNTASTSGAPKAVVSKPKEPKKPAHEALTEARAEYVQKIAEIDESLTLLAEWGQSGGHVEVPPTYTDEPVPKVDLTVTEKIKTDLAAAEATVEAKKKEIADLAERARSGRV